MAEEFDPDQPETFLNAGFAFNQGQQVGQQVGLPPSPTSIVERERRRFRYRLPPQGGSPPSPAEFIPPPSRPTRTGDARTASATARRARRLRPPALAPTEETKGDDDQDDDTPRTPPRSRRRLFGEGNGDPSAAVPQEAIFEEDTEDDTDEDYDDTESDRASVGTEDGMTEEESTDDDTTVFSLDSETDEEDNQFEPFDPSSIPFDIRRVFGFDPRNQPPRGSGISRFGRFSGMNQVFDR